MWPFSRKPKPPHPGRMLAPSPLLPPVDASKVAKADRKGIADRMAAVASAFARKKGSSLFTQPAHPPSVGGGAKLAMDSNVDAMNSWANGAIQQSMFSEGLTFLGYAYLSELSQRPEYRMIAQTFAAQMTRKGIKFKSKNQDDDKLDRIGELEAAFDKLNVMETLAKVIEQGEYFGRGHIYLDTDDTDDPKELLTPIGDGWDRISRKKVSKKHPLVALRTVEPVWCYPTDYNSNNPLKDDWYRPNKWYAQANVLHSSRLLTLVRHPVPDLLKPTYSFGGLSMSQMAKPYVDYWLDTRTSIGKILSAFSVFVLKTNLAESLMADGDELFRRVDLFNNMRSNSGLMVLDKDTEDFSNVSAPLSGLEQLQAQSQEHLSAVSHIPTVILLGLSPAGLNASSEGEIRAFYDYIAAEQKRFLRDDIRRIMGLTMLSLWDQQDEDIDFEFVPLYELTELEVATMNKTKADTDVAMIDAGMISPVEGRKNLASDPNRGYSNIDPDDAPDLGEEEEEGLEPQGGRPQPAAQEIEEAEAGVSTKTTGGEDEALPDHMGHTH